MSMGRPMHSSDNLKPEDRKDPGFGGLKKALQYIGKYRKALIAGLIMSGAGTFLGLLGPARIGGMTDIMKDGLTAGVDMNAIAKLGIILLAIYVASGVCRFFESYIIASLTLRTSKRLRQDLSEKINRVPQSNFHHSAQGDILSRITNDVQTLQQGLSNSLPNLVGAVVQFVGCLFMMFITEWRLAFCTIGITIVGLILLVVITSRTQKYFNARQESLGELNGFIEEMYTGHSVVRLSRAERKIKERFGTLNEAVYEANWRSQFLSGIMQPLMNVVGNLGYVTVCVAGAALALRGTIRFGVIISFIMFVRLFTSPLTQIAQCLTNLQTASASAKRIFDFLDTEEFPDESDKPAEMPEVSGAVEFRNVNFSYPDVPDKTIIHDFSARVRPGQKVAIVGPTGAGKTTMVNLLMRFYEINGGSISIDGTSVSDLRRDTVHQMFSMVLQDTWLFEGTVRENLVYNMPDVSDEELERVCTKCGIAHFIHSLPEGFDTVLSEDTAISAGQKQLLTIARAMLQNSPMLILDEATSSVDTRTEVLIQRAMDELMQGRTSFVIAHRLSTIKNADLILVMQNGDVIESGTHAELMEKGGAYAELYNSQFEESA